MGLRPTANTSPGVNPFSVPSEAITYDFSDDVLYNFKLDNDGDAVEVFTFRVSFDTQPEGCAADDATGVCLNAATRAA